MIDSYPLFRPLLFSLDAEQAHNLTLGSLDRAERWGLLRYLIKKPAADPRSICGITFPNPVGLAAGLDKDGKHIDALGALGFGFLEIGTVTPKPQPGNPQPRMFRLPSASAIINRMGFNNDGVNACVTRVRESTFWQNGGVVGLNIGKNASTPIENAASDYVIAMQAVYKIATYITVNISSPNTQNLRDLHGEEMLRSLLMSLDQARQSLSNQYGVRKPLFLKIAPDLEQNDIHLIADLLLEFGIDGVIATNTTISREAVKGLEFSEELGGLSGAPVRHAATQVIQMLHARLGKQIPIIGVGGILSGADAQEKISAGASLVQIYTGLIYKGPQLVTDCAKALKI
ncbi:quinone-dependent dihydroorotate dehydrogenase [Polynucleobacter antarcticus]|uniref:Dihydroorotate dehydrogenase (quinone) n=1 Tax=Polynucleobacter antarcticus TaxID=1743162 RepID=A0A6M9PK26_9BURK|nr:quinone-dependent dihydroorotate dehydrogenase [Polynucleobacter antarcticus]QKM62484.1 quinone-dependent dihydroorotate dehydrogenase [Polynucleobacter antarcticus]